ncbi:MAG: thiamine phosphate synthase [Candidatus Omnitrophica bacterium]|nr:thiamine phosphate synthase [Candidatus Omnitrophota bacterium]
MSNAISSSRWRLYVIIDHAAAQDRDLAWVAERAIQGGADVIQLRHKTASVRQLIAEAERLMRVTRAAQIPFLINDRVDVAVAVGADGVHLGQDDLPVPVARRFLGPTGIIGKSTHSLQQALEAEQEGVDYLAVGPIYPTPTKPDAPHVGLELIAQVKIRVRHPVVTIGGIDRVTLAEVVAAGADCVAVVRAVCRADDPQAAAEELKKIVTQSVRITR